MNASPTETSPSCRRGQSHTRGSAMSEMVLCMPFLILILSFLIYFGRGVVRMQHTQVMDRYESWRQAARGAPGPHADHTKGHTLLNQTFFADKAQSIGHYNDNYFPDDAPDELIDAASQVSNDAADLADTLIDRSPKGRRVRVSSTYSETVKVWQPFQRTSRHQHTRLNSDWRFADHWRRNSDGEWVPRKPGVSVLASLRDEFYDAWDKDLEVLAQDENSIARLIRRLYLNEPGYRGPTVYVFQD